MDAGRVLLQVDCDTQSESATMIPSEYHEEGGLVMGREKRRSKRKGERRRKKKKEKKEKTMTAKMKGRKTKQKKIKKIKKNKTKIDCYYD